MKTPPPIQQDPQGRVSNFAEIARFAYVNDPTFRKTHSISDLTGESYTARLERHIVTQIHALHAIRTAGTTRPPMTLTPTVALSVTSPDDAHETTMEETSHVGAVALALFTAVAIGAGIYAWLTGHSWIAAACYGLAAGSVYCLFQKGGTP